MFRDFVESGYYPEGVNAITYDDANSLFYEGKAAMLPTGTWLISAIVETVQNFEVDFFPFPSIDGSDIAPAAGTGTGLFVAKNATNSEGAITFIDYVLQNDTARLLTEKLLTSTWRTRSIRRDSTSPSCSRRFSRTCRNRRRSEPSATTLTS